MKANPKKLGGRKGDRMTPDWLDGYVIVGLTDHQVVLRNTKTNKVLKSISLAHIKPFRDRPVDGKNEVESVQVEGALDEVKGECHVSEDNGNDDDDDDDGEMIDGEGKDVDCESQGICDENNDVHVKDIDVGGEVKGVCDTKVEGVDGEVKGVCDSKIEGVGGCKAKGFGDCKVENAGRSIVAQTFDGEVERLKKLTVGGVPLHEPFLDFGPAKLTAKDIWSIIPPQEIPASQVEMLKNAAPGFMPGWLSDMVS